MGPAVVTAASPPGAGAAGRSGHRAQACAHRRRRGQHAKAHGRPRALLAAQLGSSSYINILAGAHPGLGRDAREVHVVGLLRQQGAPGAHVTPCVGRPHTPSHTGWERAAEPAASSAGSQRAAGREPCMQCSAPAHLQHALGVPGPPVAGHKPRALGVQEGHREHAVLVGQHDAALAAGRGGALRGGPDGERARRSWSR